MAVYYFNRNPIGRTSGASAVAAAAYRHAARMTNERTGDVRNYSGKAGELVHAEITLPENAPASAVARYGGADVDAAAERLWNDVEIREDQHNRHASAQLALSYTIALPVELSHEQSIALMRDFVQTSLVTGGATADWVIHDKGDGNPHVHVMTTLRTLGKTGLDQKIRTYQDRRQDIVNLRFNWACAANSALETAGFEARIDHRRLDAQGIELGAISFNAEVAENIEQGDAAYRVKQRVMEARLENEVYLMANPEHMLTVVAASNPLFTEADLERGFQQYLPTSVGRKGIAGLMGLALASGDLVRLDRTSSRDEPFLTTRAVVEMTRQMERDALTMAQSTLVLGADQGREALSAALSDEQGRAVRAMLSPRRLSLVTGYAGSGKTFAVKEAAKVWAARGFAVLGGAISGKATQELSGIEGAVATLAQWEARWDRGERPAQGKFIFVMDEAGMVGTAIWSRMQARIEAMGGKLIAVGDAAQLAPIQDTAAFKHLTKLVGQVTIGEVRRQDDAGDRRATEMLSRGGAEADVAIDHYAQKGAIRFEGSLGAAIDALSKAYFEHEGIDRIALTHRNADVDALNAAIRIEALGRGAVDHKSQVFYERGEGVDPLGWQGISCPRNPLALGIGDRVRFTRPFREGSVTKSSFASVIAASETQLILSVDGRDGIVTVDPRRFLHFDYGYAATVHKSQGMTVANNVEVLVTSQFDAHLLDVSLSRHKQTVRIWAPEDSVPDVGAIKAMAQRSSLIDVVAANDPPVLGRMTRDISDVAVGARVDRIAPRAGLAAEAALPRQGPGLADQADPFESGTGPILIELPSGERTGNAREEHEEREAASLDGDMARHTGPAGGGGAHYGDGARGGGRDRGAAQRAGPGVANVREALNVWAEDLFRASFGEPVASRSAEWRARESGAIAMRMRGPSRGLWTDHRSGEGGDLLDLVARSFCGLGSARDDFPKVMEEAIRFTGLSGAAVDDLAALAMRRQARVRAAADDEGRKAALVNALVAQALPIKGSPASAYLAARGIGAVPDEGLGWLPSQPAFGSVPGQGVRSPEHGALVVWARDETGAITGGQRILVNGDGTRVEIDVRKPAFGSISGCPARFAARGSGDTGAGPLVIAEGPESALSIWQATGHEAWAVFGASGWGAAPLPTDRPVIFAPDRDAPDSPAGVAFRAAVAKHVGAGCDLHVAVAPELPGSKRDLNDTDQRAGAGAVRAAIAAARPVVADPIPRPVTEGQPSVEYQPPVLVTGLAGDVHLMQQGLRMAGLLRAEYEPGQPELADDPRGYAIDPLKAVDDLLAERGDFRAADVAARLGKVVRAPDLFVRLFAQAMSHPDLVVLSEEGLRGEGRVYSSVSRVAQVTGLMDRGVTLAVTQGASAAGVVAEAALVDTAAQSAGLSDTGRAGLEYALWPSRIGILEEIGTSETARVVQALGEITQQTGHQVIVVSADTRAATRFAAAATDPLAPGIEGLGLYAFGNRLRQGSLSLRARDILVVPEASGLHVDDLDLLMGFAEQSGAKLLLHSDPSLDAVGSVVRHLGARVETSVLGGLEAIVADRRGLIEGGATLEATYKALWNKDVFLGSATDEIQVDDYVAGFIADETAGKLGVASSVRLRDLLNMGIEAELLKKKGSLAEQVHRIDRGEAPALSVHEGTVLKLCRDLADQGLTAGARGVVRSVDAAGQVTARFGAQDVVFMPGAQAAGLDYGYVFSAREARGVAVDSLHGFAGRGLRRPDLIAMLGAGERFSLSLPVDPDNEGAAFLRQALAREGRGSVLDYGFDPAHALAAAAEAHQDRGPDGAPAQALSATDLAVRADTAAHLQAQPAFIVSALVRETSRFDHGQLLDHVQKLFPAADYPAFDHKDFTQLVLSETLKQGALIEAGFSSYDGAALYTTRVQAEIEARGLSDGNALACSKLDGIDSADMTALPTDVAHVSGAERLSLATVDPGPPQDRFLQQAGALWRERGYQVIATSTRGVLAEQAAARLGDDVQHASLASLEAQWAMGRLPEEKFVVVLDEAERVSAAQWMRVQARVAEMGGKLIAVSHSSGLSPIGSVSLYRLLAREVGIEQRVHIAHQTRKDERIATSYLSVPALGSQPTLGSQHGAPAAKALDIYNNKGAVRFAGRAEGAQAAIARAYWADGYRQAVEVDGEVRLAMAHARVMADTLDAAIRAEGQRLGHLGIGETCWGRHVNIGEVLEAKSDIGLAQVKAGDRGRVVKLGPESIELEMPGHRETVEIYTGARMGQFRSSMATTIHDAESRVVDRGYLYASKGMDQEMFRVGMTRHRQSLDLHVPETAFRDYDALQKAVQRNADLEMLADVSSKDVSRDAVKARDITGRPDRTGAALWSGGDFGMDAHLQATAGRIAGLMAIDYRRGAPVLGDDPRGYALAPCKLVDDLLAQRSVIRASDVARSLSGVLRDPDSFVRLFAEAMSHPDLVVLSEEGLRGEGRVYSTLAHIRRELDLVDKVSALALAQSDINPTTARLKAAARTAHGPMSLDQERALRHATGSARVAMISGIAGSGKSSVLKGVRDIYEREGWTVIGAALAGKAAQGLQDASGIQSTTLAALGFAAAQERVTLGPKTLLVVDEAGMLNADHFEMVLDLVERTGASLRLVGDPRQLQPRGPGAMWRAFADRIGTVDLTTVWRQHDPADREATRNLAAGGDGADLAIDHFLDKGVVHATGTDPNVGSDRDALLTAAVAGYCADPHEDKMLLTYRLADVADMNRMARADDQARRSDDLPCIAVGKSGGDVLELQAGDRIAFRENRRVQGIVNGMTGRIAEVNLARQSFTVQIGTDKDEARYITLKAEDSPDLDYGYATTLHKSQGGTHESSHLVVTGSFNHSLLYVGATRYRSDLAIYAPVDEDKVGDYLKTLARREPAQTTTLEAAYGFDTGLGFEAARQARAIAKSKAEEDDRAETRAEDSAQDGDLGDYVARHNGVPRSVSMPLGPLSRLFARAPEREALAAGADTRAVSDVVGAHILGHGAPMAAEVQARATRLLQEVSSAKSWSNICKTLPRDIPARTEAIATRWTNSQIGPNTFGEELLPEARAFGRAIAVADNRADSLVARALKSGLELLSARVDQARRDGSYAQMLKAATTPTSSSEVSSQDLMDRAQPIVARAWRGPSRSVAPVRSSGVWLGGGPGSVSELAAARQVIRSFSSKGPGFWETLLSDYGDHRKGQAAGSAHQAGAGIAKEKDMEQSVGKKLTPITQEHQKVLAHALNPEASRDLTDGIALGDYAGQIGTGTMKFGDMQKTANAFRQMAVEVGSIGPCDPSVPETWKARLLEAVKFGAAFEKMPKVESIEEWSWAMSHSLRIGALATGPQDLTRAQAGVAPTWADCMAATMIADIKHRPDDKSTTQSMNWETGLINYVSQVTYVPFMKVHDAALALAKSDLDVIKDKLAGEEVPQEWKNRLTDRLANRNDYSAQPRFASLEESEWAISTMVTKGAEVSTGRTPTPNDLVKAVMEEQGLGMSMRPF